MSGNMGLIPTKACVQEMRMAFPKSANVELVFMDDAYRSIGTSLGVECQYNRNLPSKWYFNAFEREKAIAAAKEVAYRRGDTNSISYIENAEHIEILMPECIRQNPQSWNEPGDSWLNQLEEITESTGSAFEAGLMAIAMANKA